MTDEANDFLMGGGARAFPFTSMGDEVNGEILSMTKRQQTHIESGQPQFWDNGDPKMMLVIVLQTALGNGDDDDGTRSIYVRGGNYNVAKGKGASMQVAIKEAVRKSGAGKIEVGGTLAVQYSGEAPASKGRNPAKLYTASYHGPTNAIDVDDLL